MTTFPEPPSWLSEIRAIVRLATPVAAAQFGMMLLGAVDCMMSGHLSRSALGAVTLGNVYTFGVMIFFNGILFALDPLVAQAHGAKDQRSAGLWLLRGIVLALAISVISVLLFCAAGPVLRALKQPESVIPTAVHYAWAIAPSVPAFFLFIVLRQSLQAMSIVRPVLLTVIFGNLANVVLNYLFIFGRFGFPKWGAVGSGVATSICRFLMLAGLLFLARKALRPLWIRPKRELLRWREFRKILKIGMPIGLQVALEVWVFMASTLFVGRMGERALSGHQIAMNLASLAFMIPLGIGAAAATRVGNAIGRLDPLAARRSAFVALILGASVMSVSGAVFALLPERLARFYSNEADVLALAVQLLPIAALFGFFDGTQAVGCGILRGAADTRAAAVINLLGYWVLALPLGIALARGMGPRGVWLGLTAGLATVAVLLIGRVRHRFSLEALPLPVSASPLLAEHDQRHAAQDERGADQGV